MTTKKKIAQRAYVVVRTYSAGVHVGELVSRKGPEVKLANARRVWSWKGANTLHEMANAGVAAGSRVSQPVSSIELMGAIEVLATTKAGEASLRGAQWSA